MRGDTGHSLAGHSSRHAVHCPDPRGTTATAAAGPPPVQQRSSAAWKRHRLNAQTWLAHVPTSSSRLDDTARRVTHSGRFARLMKRSAAALLENVRAQADVGRLLIPIAAAAGDADAGSEDDSVEALDHAALARCAATLLTTQPLPSLLRSPSHSSTSPLLKELYSGLRTASRVAIGIHRS